jgi:hypothetical protein
MNATELKLPIALCTAFGLAAGASAVADTPTDGADTTRTELAGALAASGASAVLLGGGVVAGVLAKPAGWMGVGLGAGLIAGAGAGLIAGSLLDAREQ